MSTRTLATIAVAAAAFVGCAPRSDRTETASGTAASDSTFVDGVQARLRPVSTGHLINTVGVEALRREGLSDPIGQIVDSLMAHREVIPHEGVLGGRMGFYSAQGIHVLDESWVFAKFDDGHIQGRGLFRYAIQADSSLTFEVVYSEVD